MDNCLNLKRKRTVEGESICTTTGVTSEDWGDQAPVRTYCFCPQIKRNWILLWVGGSPFSALFQQAWMPRGLDVSWLWYILHIPTALLCSHLVFFCYHEGFSLTKTWEFLWQKFGCTGTCYIKRKYEKPHKILCLLFIMFWNIKDSTGTGVHSAHGGVLGFVFFVVLGGFFVVVVRYSETE